MTELKLPSFIADANPDIINRAKQNKVMFLDLKDVHPNPLNMYPLKDVARYAENISTSGILTPITVISKEEGYVIFAGHTRYAALNRLVDEGYRYTYIGQDITGKVPALTITPFENEIEERKAMMASNYTKDLTANEKGRLIEECLEIIELEKSDGTREKGRTAHLISAMVPFPEFFIKNYLAKRNTEGEDVMSSSQILLEKKKECTKICMQIRRLSKSLTAFDWEAEDVDTSVLLQLSDRLKEILDDRLGGYHDDDKKDGEE